MADGAEGAARGGQAVVYAARDGEADRWSDFFSRVLPQPGSGSYINNEDDPEQSFDVSASNAVRVASLRALGWPDGRLPGKKVLLEHMLTRAEYEYAEHLFDHGLEPGEWCDVCQCICARVDGDESESNSVAGDDCGMDSDPHDDWDYLARLARLRRPRKGHLSLRCERGAGLGSPGVISMCRSRRVGRGSKLLCLSVAWLRLKLSSS